MMMNRSISVARISQKLVDPPSMPMRPSPVKVLIMTYSILFQNLAKRNNLSIGKAR